MLNYPRAAAVVLLLLLAAATPGGGLVTGQTKSDAADPQTIRALIKDLGDDAFKTRDAADKRLAAIGEPALELLREAAQHSDDAEVRLRARELVRGIEAGMFQQVRRFTGHNSQRLPWICRVVLTPDGKQAISSAFDGLRVWDLESGKQLAAFGDTSSGLWSLAISHDGQRIITGGDGKVARIYEVSTGKLLQELVGHNGAVWGAVLLPDGKRAVTGAWDQSLRVWDVETGKELRAFENVRDNVRCLALAPDGKTVVAGHFAMKNAAATVRLWDVDKGTEIRAFEGHTKEVCSVAFSPDGKQIVSTSYDTTVRIWDVDSGKEVKRLEGSLHRLEYAVFTPDGKRIVACAKQETPTVRVWDVASAKLLLESEDVPAGFLCVAVLPDSRHCVTAGRDHMVRLWKWNR